MENTRTNDVSRENESLTLSCFSRSFTSQQVQTAKVKEELLCLRWTWGGKKRHTLLRKRNTLGDGYIGKRKERAKHGYSVSEVGLHKWHRFNTDIICYGFGEFIQSLLGGVLMILQIVVDQTPFFFSFFFNVHICYLLM